jgi:hypothetical protein
LGAIRIAISFNLKTNCIVKSIQVLEESRGRSWLFWSNTERLHLFLFRPLDLICSTDTQEIIDAKKKLINHRMTAKRSFLKCFVFLFAGVVLAVATLAIIGLFQHMGFP